VNNEICNMIYCPSVIYELDLEQQISGIRHRGKKLPPEILSSNDIGRWTIAMQSKLG